MREHASNYLHKKVLLMAGPIIISNATVPLVGMVDTAVVGHLPNPAYIGAVALGAAIFSFVFWGFSFLRMGTTGFVAQAHGADDAREIRTVLARGLMLALLLGGLILLLRESIITVALAVLDSTAEIESLSADYVRLRIWAAPAMLINFTLLGALIGLQRAGLALLLQLLLNLSNIALDLLFVLGLGYAVKGVALASALSEWLAALAGLLIIYRQLRPDSGGWFYPLWNSRELLAMMRDVFGGSLLTSIMPTSAEIDNASSRLKTVFELDRPVTSRDVHVRCLKYLNAVCEEIETDVVASWSRRQGEGGS